ncbi:MAG: 6-carboxytetrahydropterin synthase [Nitrospiraceae bacterium]
MASASVTRRYRFCAAHRLHSDLLTPEENCTVFGKCNNPNGHGHNYVVFVTVSSGNDGQQAGITDIDSLDAIVTDTIVKRFDHRDLNQDPLFTDQTTTGENLVVVMWNLLQRRLSTARLEKVGIIETRDNYFEYAGAGRLRLSSDEVNRG